MEWERSGPLKAALELKSGNYYIVLRDGSYRLLHGSRQVATDPTLMGIKKKADAHAAKPGLAMGATAKDGTGKKWGAKRIGSGTIYYEWQPESLPHSSGGRTWTNPARWEHVDPYYMPAGLESALDRLLDAAPKAKPKPKPKAKPTLSTGLTIRSKENPEWGTWQVTGPARGVPGVWEIRSDRRGHSRTLGESEFSRFWEAVRAASAATTAKIKADIQKGWDEFDRVYVLTAPDGRTFAFRTKKPAQKFKGTVVRASVQRRAFLGVGVGKPAPVHRRAGQWYPGAVGGTATKKKATRAALAAGEARATRVSEVITYRVELANRVEGGRAVGNLYGVAKMRGRRRAGWALQPQEDRDRAYRTADDLNAGKKATKKKASKKVSRKSPADSQAATELAIYAASESSIYPQRQAIEENLRKKYRKGKYDHSKAPKAWAYWMELAAKGYAKDHANASEWSTIFTKPTRELAAKERADEFYGTLKIEEKVEVAKPKAAKKKATKKKATRRAAKFAPGDRVSFDIPATVFMPARFGEGVVETVEGHRILVRIDGGLPDWMLPAVLKKKKATKKKAARRVAKPKNATIYISGLGSDFKAEVKWSANGTGDVRFFQDGGYPIGSATYRWSPTGVREIGMIGEIGSNSRSRIRELMRHWITVSAREGLTEVRQTLDSLEQSVEIRTRPASKHNSFGRLKDSPAASTMDAHIAKYTKRSYTRDDAQILIEAASKWLEYGPDYDRNIASAADDVVQALVRNQGVSSFSGILALRLADKGLLPLLRLKKATKKATKKRTTKKKATRKKAVPRAGASDKYPRVRIDFSNAEYPLDNPPPKGKRTVEEFDKWMVQVARTESPGGGYNKIWPKIYVDGKREPYLEMRVDADHALSEGRNFLAILHQRIAYATRMLEEEPTGRVAEDRRRMLPGWQGALDALDDAPRSRKAAKSVRGDKAFENLLATLLAATKVEFRKGNRRWVVERDPAAPYAERWVRMTGDGAYMRGFPSASAALESVFEMATKKKATKKKAAKKATKKKATKKKAKKATRNRAAEGRAKRAKKKNVRKKARVAKKKVAPRKKRTAAEERKILNAWKRGAGAV